MVLYLFLSGVVATQDGILGAKIHCNGFETFKKKRFVKVLVTVIFNNFNNYKDFI